MEFLKNVKNHGMLLLLIAAWFGVLFFVSDQDDQAVPEVNEIYTFLQASPKSRQFWAMSNYSNTTNGTVTGNQSVAGNQTISSDVTYSAGTFTFADAGTMTIEAGITVTFAADAIVDITAATVFGGAGTVVFESGATGTWTARVTFDAAVTITNFTCSVADVVFASATGVTSSNWTTANQSSIQFRSSNITWSSTTLGGLGEALLNLAGALLSQTSGSVMSIPLTIGGVTTLPAAKSHRGMLTTVSGATASTCGSTYSALTVASGSATHADLSCTLSGTSYSSEVTALSYATGSYSQYIGVSGSGLPLYSGSVTGLDLPTIEVTNTGSGVFVQELLNYPATTCVTSFAATSWDTCASGYTCSITGGASGSNCGVFFNQVLTQAADDSNDGLYALFALFACPLALLIGLAIMKLVKPKPLAPIVTEIVEEYPVYSYAAAQPAYPAVYPTATAGYDVSMPVPPSSLY
jgi:hypothetical protein